ncbi:hypothetical protein NliqN6_1737 [Naganishia liquefaciens]|uniref:Uncharacterized protein n=1 Tax=Naganishia liquefaciens TaxID=104408 RepID=A0A8H3TRL2_9TREE|nr:hypothetical protein NliqN6_1737 [Naganishia liquefaciens]
MDKRFVPQSSAAVKVSASAFIVLNVVRFLSIVALILIMVSQMVGASNDAVAYRESELPNAVSNTTYLSIDEDCDYFELTSVPDQPGGIFWAILNRTFIIIVIFILLPTELIIPVKRLTQFYLDYIPVISPSHGLGILGVVQCWIASTVLSKYVQRTPQTKAAHKIYTTYNDKFETLRPFADVAVSAMSKNKNPAPAQPGSDRQAYSSTENLLHKDEKKSQTYTEPDVDRPSGSQTAHGEPSGTKRFSKVQGVKFGSFGFGKQAQKSGNLKGLVITRPMETLPRFAPNAAYR